MCYWLAFLVLCFSADALAAAPYKELPSVDRLRREIQHDGARAVLDRLYSNQDVFDRLLGSIGTGDRAWLDVAILLKPASDAGSSEMLTAAMSEALLNAPGRVLLLVTDNSREFKLHTVCDGVHVGTDLSPAQYRAWLRRAERVLRKYRPSPATSQKKEQCLSAIAEALAYQEKHHSPPN
jgi:hypothetical protein